MACVYIPVQNSEEEVRVALDQLPRDASDILDILKAEQAPLDLWLIIAREYFKQGKIEQFRQILEEGSSPEIDEYYADVRYERIAILNALGAYYSYLGKIETKQREKEEHFILATQYYNKASRIDMHEPSTWVGKGQLLLAKGEVEQAFAAFKIVLEGDRDNVPALLGQACVEFNRGRYSDSLELYKRALQVYPNCPGAVRLGIGLCRYKLGQFEKARQAFQRVLQLDSENVEALVALAIMDLQANDAAGIQKGMGQMRRAFEIYPYCAMALNYLANHFFFTGQHFLVEQLTETALAVTNHGPTKSHSYYNLARSYHSKGDYEKAGFYYMASIKEINKPHEFIFPYYGLGQVKLKSGDFRSALSNFEKVLEVYPDNSETLKALGHIYVQLGQVEKALEFMKKATKIDPRDAQAFLDLGELLISFDTGAALDAFKTARNLLEKGGQAVPVEVLNNIGVIHFEREELELALESFNKAVGDGVWHALTGNKPKSYIIEAMASILDYKDMQLFHRLEEDGLSVELPWNKVTVVFNLARLHEQLHNTGTANLLYRLILFKYPDYIDAYLRLAAIAKARNNLQLSIDLVNEALKVNDKCPNALSMLGDLELKNDDWVKAKETFRSASDATDGKDSYAILSLGNWNYFAAIRNEKRNPKLEATHLEKAKELYTRYQNCLRKFYHNTDSQILLYLARTHYEAEQWQECKKTLLRAIHLAPSNYTLRFDAGVAMQKFSTSTLQKEKRTADEVRSTVAELENAVRIFSQLSAASNLHLHGFDEKKINTHVEYCKHLLDAAKVHREAAEREEQQNRQKQEAARQLALAEEARRKAEEQRKFLLERRKQEDEQKRLQQAEEHFKRVQEQWKSSIPASKRRERSEIDDEEGGHSEKRRRKGGKRRKKDKKKTRYDRDDEEPDMMDDREELEDEDANMNYRESTTQMNDQDDENTGENAQDLLAAAGLEDSDVEDEPVAPSSAAGRRRQAWSESDDDEPLQRGPESSPARENSAELQESDGEIREDNSKLNGAAALDDEED
ncbi:protein CTR9 homolog isoform X2 [Durio zibethinus]|uniref:Protein CTR9 homolog isoform X2 n=1 Tax=Durio zibethinus TaxID=66656 RepID=A0A6P5ZPH2_DURZI|nr:protein CTR9 homolog isoform X2 [Durio zibethinus]